MRKILQALKIGQYQSSHLKIGIAVAVGTPNALLLVLVSESSLL